MSPCDPDTGAFYALDEASGDLLRGPHYVLNAEFELHRDLKDTYTYPVHGWYWFDSDAEARTFFGLEAAE